jgi:hypothetical protein
MFIIGGYPFIVKVLFFFSCRRAISVTTYRPGDLQGLENNPCLLIRPGILIAPEMWVL